MINELTFKLESIKAAIFDLDGVIVDTAKYHYLAWKRLANELGFDFTIEDNEKLKGVSRKESLEILLIVGRMENKFSEKEKESLMDKKNRWYLEYINSLTKDELLPGARELINKLRKVGIKTGLATASKNAFLILEKVQIFNLFDAIVDGNKITKAKPDPEVFLACATELGAPPEECIVLEDAPAGIQAAKTAGMIPIGVGKKEKLKEAKIVVESLSDMLRIVERAVI